MKIRTATADDAPEMATAYISAFKEVDPTERWNEESASELVRFLLRCQPDLSFVAELQGEIVGGISGMAKPWWDGCHLVQKVVFGDVKVLRKRLRKKIDALQGSVSF